MLSVRSAVSLLCALQLVLTVGLQAAQADPQPAGVPRVQFSGVYPHLAALSTSYSESGIGAVVPWAGKLWYVSYVAHISGEGVGLFEIDPDLNIRRRPESVVGTHAGRMIHRESNQLIIGPYAIDAEGNVRVFEGLTKERVTAVMRHLTDPEHKIYFMAMEGCLYEADVETLESKRLFDLRKELAIPARTHFKGAYTAQGRVVVANNTYFAEDQERGTGGGRLAEWDGKTWKILHRTAFCDVTTAAGVDAIPNDNLPLYATGWDRRSVLLAVLTDGEWTTYRLPKGSQSYDQAWCTEWPRIREVAPGMLMLDMHGLYYEMSPEFRTGNAGGLVPMVSHLKMTPDFCRWNDTLVLAGNENSAMNHRHRTGGQPQSNLWFGTLDDLRRWGAPGGWGGPWYNDPVRAGIPSEPMLVRGFKHRTLHVWQPTKTTSSTGITRCTDRFPIVALPDELAGLDFITVDRGAMAKPAPGYTFEVDQDVTVYLAVHDRGNPHLPDGWKRTTMKIEWEHGATYTDTLFQRTFKAGTVEVPGHDGQDERAMYGVPHMCFLRPAASDGADLKVTNLPGDLNAKLGRLEVHVAAAQATFTVEIDRDGSGTWTKYTTLEVPAGGYAWHVFPEDLDACWVRLIADRDTVAGAQFYFGPSYADAQRDRQADLFASLPPVDERAPRIQGTLLPFAERLWFHGYVAGAEGEGRGLGLYEIDKDVRQVRRGESLAGVFANRLMVSNQLNIGPHLIREDGKVRTLQALEGLHVAATARHPDPGKMYLLTIDGRLLEADLESLVVREAADVAASLGLKDAELVFKAMHLAGSTLIVAACSPYGCTGCLAEWNGNGWKTVDGAAFAEVMNLGAMSEQVIALGWDEASALLKTRVGAGRWKTYRLPKASRQYDRFGAQQWPRVREVVTERMFVDLHGLFYEVSGLTFAWSVKPVAAHRRLISDYGTWRGLLVLTGNHAQAGSGGNFVRGDSGAGLWFGTTDDLWQLDPPGGEGGPWLDTPVQAGQVSDPYLMANFENKRVELSHDAQEPVTFTLQLDPAIHTRDWQTYKTIVVEPGQKRVYTWPRGFSAHWVRLSVDRACRATAQFIYD